MQENEKREDNYYEPVKKSWQGLAIDWGVARRKQSCVSDSRLHTTNTVIKRKLYTRNSQYYHNDVFASFPLNKKNTHTPTHTSGNFQFKTYANE